MAYEPLTYAALRQAELQRFHNESVQGSQYSVRGIMVPRGTSIIATDADNKYVKLIYNETLGAWEDIGDAKNNNE